MSSLKRKVIWVVGFVFVLLAALVVSAPHVATWYVNQRPDVKVRSVDLGWGCARLRDVQVTKGRISLTSPSIRVCSDHNVFIEGGVAWVILGSEGDASATSGYTIRGSSLRVHVEKEGQQVELQGVSFDPTSVQFEVATLESPYGVIRVLSGRVARDKTSATLQRVSLASQREVLGHPVGEVLAEGVDLHFEKGTIKGSISNLSREQIRANRLTFIKEPDFVSTHADEVVLFDERLHTEHLTFSNVGVLMNPSDKEHLRVGVNGASIYVDVATQSISGEEHCQTWLEALPKELHTGPLSEVNFSDRFGFRISTKPKVQFEMHGFCKVGGIPPFLAALRKTFTYTAYNAQGEPFTRTSGPGSSSWVPLGLMSPNLVRAITTTEDPGFFSHKGFIRQAIENSIADDLKAGKFVRGGSTITMQLAKNLWLPRSKTIARKVQEAFLTMALESVLTKEEILALYFNVVEYGSNLYGIGPATEYYFHEGPMSLTLMQSLYLTTLLPHPHKILSFEAKKRSLESLMRMMVKNGKMTEEELQAEVFEDP